MGAIVRQNDEFIDNVIEMAYKLNGNSDGLEDCKLTHIFTPGLYTRIFFMPAGIYVVSKIHKTEHPFVILTGEVEVSVDAGQSQLLKAPYTGITKAGTRRILKIIKDTNWLTVHATDIVPESNSEEDIIKAAEKVEDIIIEKRDYKFLNDKKEALCHSQS